jgi:myo-inositol 2-dehydrogenase/D-chiro-inositol 1-dehydrogenase
MYNIGLLGIGRIGRLLTKKIKSNFPNYKVSHAFNPSQDEKWCRNNGVILCKTEDHFWNSDIHIVFICSPSDQHSRQIIRAAEKKIPIFCEKPLGTNIRDIELSIKAVEKNNVYFQIGFNRRFDRDFMELRNKITNMGSIPHLLRITSRDPKYPDKKYIAKSGGICFDMTIHDFDIARYLFDSEIIEIYAFGSCLVHPSFENLGDFDTLMVQIKFSNGSIGIIDNSRRAVYGYDQRIEVFSNKGNYFANNYHKNNIKRYTSNGVYNSELKYFFLDRYDQAYDTQLGVFFESIEKKLKSPISIYDGYQAVKISQAAHKSLKEQKPILI